MARTPGQWRDFFKNSKQVPLGDLLEILDLEARNNSHVAHLKFGTAIAGGLAVGIGTYFALTALELGRIATGHAAYALMAGLAVSNPFIAAVILGITAGAGIYAGVRVLFAPRHAHLAP